MKHLYLAIMLTIIGLSSCKNAGQKGASLSGRSHENIVGLYDFVQTNDNEFCNPDSLIPGDCDGGSIYLTDKGNAIFIAYCLGADSDKYKIGTYSVSEADVICNFNRAYYIPIDPFLENSKAVLNAGKIKLAKSIILKLNRLSCDKYNLGFTSPEGEKFVLFKSDKEHTKYFMKTYSQIGVFSAL